MCGLCNSFSDCKPNHVNVGSAQQLKDPMLKIILSAVLVQSSILSSYVTNLSDNVYSLIRIFAGIVVSNHISLIEFKFCENTSKLESISLFICSGYELCYTQSLIQTMAVQQFVDTEKLSKTSTAHYMIIWDKEKLDDSLSQRRTNRPFKLEICLLFLANCRKKWKKIQSLLFYNLASTFLSPYRV